MEIQAVIDFFSDAENALIAINAIILVCWWYPKIFKSIMNDW